MAALKVRASDYLKIPLSIEELLVTVTKNLPEPFQQSLSRHESDVLASLDDLIMIGKSTAMRKIMDHIPRVAATDSTVLITGETGTGKELAAELIHRYSPRGHRPFICINCAALPDNLLESELFGYERQGGLSQEPSARKGGSSSWLKRVRYFLTKSAI